MSKIFAEINSAGREIMFWNAFCVDFISEKKVLTALDKN